MKIFIATNSSGGLYNFRRELLETLVKDHSVTICSPAGEYVDDMIGMGCTFAQCAIDRHGMNPIKEIGLLRYYRKMLRKYRPDLVLTYTIKPNIYAGLACSMLKIPYIANITGLGTAIQNGGFKQKMVLWLYKKGLKRAQKVFFQNKTNMEFMLSHNAISGPWDLIPGSGVNLSKHCFEEYPEDGDRISLLVVGRIMRDKGSGEVLNAAQQLHKEFPNLMIRMIGRFDGNYQQKVEDAVTAGYIEYLGFQKDVHSFYRTCHGVLHASYHEGMSNVLLESAASGRPVIATNVPGCIETYDDGISGIAFKPRDPEDLIRAVRAFMNLSNEERKQMGLAGRRKIEKEFDRALVIQKYQDEIELTKKG